MPVETKDPAFLFYYQDFLVGTDHMTNEQVGMYIKALCHQANRGSIRQEHLKKICVTRDNHLVILEKFTELENGDLCNLRLRNETEKRKKFSESRRNNRLGKHKNNICRTQVAHMENENENVNENIINNKTNLDNSNHIHNNNNNNINKFKKPTIEEVRKYCIERRNNIDVETFWNFYEANGWKQGSKPLKSWKACIVTWERRTLNGGAVSPKNVAKKDPLADCLSCHGSGKIYAPGSGKNVDCTCTEVKP